MRSTTTDGRILLSNFLTRVALLLSVNEALPIISYIRIFVTAWTGWCIHFLKHLFHLMSFKYRTYIALFCSQYYRVNTVRLIWLYLPYKESSTRHLNVIYHIRIKWKVDKPTKWPPEFARLNHILISLYQNKNGTTV